MLFMKIEDNWNACVVSQYMQLCFQIAGTLKPSSNKAGGQLSCQVPAGSDHTGIEAFSTCAAHSNFSML